MQKLGVRKEIVSFLVSQRGTDLLVAVAFILLALSLLFEIRRDSNPGQAALIRDSGPLKITSEVRTAASSPVSAEQAERMKAEIIREPTDSSKESAPATQESGLDLADIRWHQLQARVESPEVAKVPWAKLLARFYYKPNIHADNPTVNVKAHIFFSKDGRLIKSVFKGLWDGDEYLEKRFSSAEAHDLVVGMITMDGKTLVSCEHNLVRLRGTARRIEHLEPTCDPQATDHLNVKIVAIGKYGQRVLFNKEMKLTLRFNADSMPEINLDSET